MRCYGSFLVRCWLTEGESPGERPARQVEHIRTGELKRSASLREAEEWMLECCRAARAGAGTTPETKPGPGGGGPEAAARTTNNSSKE